MAGLEDGHSGHGEGFIQAGPLACDRKGAQGRPLTLSLHSARHEQGVTDLDCYTLKN